MSIPPWPWGCRQKWDDICWGRFRTPTHPHTHTHTLSHTDTRRDGPCVSAGRWCFRRAQARETLDNPARKRVGGMVLGFDHETWGSVSTSSGRVGDNLSTSSILHPPSLNPGNQCRRFFLLCRNYVCKRSTVPAPSVHQTFVIQMTFTRLFGTPPCSVGHEPNFSRCTPLLPIPLVGSRRAGWDGDNFPELNSWNSEALPILRRTSRTVCSTID